MKKHEDLGHRGAGQSARGLAPKNGDDLRQPHAGVREPARAMNRRVGMLLLWLLLLVTPVSAPAADWPRGITGTCATTNAVAAFTAAAHVGCPTSAVSVQGSLNIAGPEPWITVTTPTGAAIQEAIDSLPASGGTIRLTGQAYLVSSTITIGNGSGSGGSTRNNVKLIGHPNAQLFWTGDATGPVLQVNGSIYGVEISGFTISGANTAKTVVKVISASGWFHDLTIANPRDSSGGDNPVGLHLDGNAISGNFNAVWERILIIAQRNGAIGLRLGPTDATTGFGMSQCTFRRFTIYYKGDVAGAAGVLQEAVDNNIFEDFWINHDLTAGDSIRRQSANAGFPGNNVWRYVVGLDGVNTVGSAGADLWIGYSDSDAPGTTPGVSQHYITTNGMARLVSLRGHQIPEEAAPGVAPPGATGHVWQDSTAHRFHDMNAAGITGTTVVADPGASNNFLTAISTAGVISKAQPSAANLSNGTTGSGAVVLATSPAVAASLNVTSAAAAAFQTYQRTNAANAALAAGDVIMNLGSQGTDGTGMSAASRAVVRTRAAATWSGSSNPTDVVFLTNPVGSLGAVEVGSFTASGHLQLQKALVTLGGGAAPTLGTIGGSGPATAAQNTWLELKDSTGAAFWVPAWK